MAIIDFYDRGWAIDPDGVAYIQDERSFTFTEVGELTCRIANKLLALELPRGTKCAIWAANDVTAWACTLGVWRAAMTWVPVNAHNSSEDNQYILDAFDCEVLFYQRRFEDVLSQLRPQLPRIRHWICIDAGTPSDPHLAEWCSHQPSAKPRIRYDLDDLINLTPTGGTTGMPKGVMISHRNMQVFVVQYMLRCAYYDGQTPVNLAAAPMTHTAGMNTMPCTARGGTVVVVPKPDPLVMLTAIAKHRVTEFWLPPTAIYKLLEVPDIGSFDTSSLKYLNYGAAPMSLEKLKKAITVFGPILCGGYGQTEAPGSISALRSDEHFISGHLAHDERLTSVGRPNPLVQVEIMNDANEPQPRGASGEICVGGDLVMRGYYKSPEKTAEAIIDGWLHTGDVGHFDAEGYLHITDRKKDMIITGGFNVYPTEVEQVIWSHAAVQDCAVIGVPDEKWGESVKAVVELNPGQTVTAEDLISLCKTKLGGVKAPKTIDFVDSLPRSPVGKVMKKDLRARYWAASQQKI